MPIDKVPYIFPGPFMDTSVPSTALKEGRCGRIVGADGRYSGCIRKFFGMTEVKDLDEIDTNMDVRSGPYYMKAVTFQKRGTSSVYRGFVVSWDEGNSTTNLALDLFYTLNNGTAWSSHEIWAQSGSGITTTTEIDCTVDGAFLMVAVDGKATKTVYYATSALTTVDTGPGNFDSELTTMSFNTTTVNTSYQLIGNGRYQVAYRFYDSTRGIYSALSAPFIFALDQMNSTKATGTVSFAVGGGDSGRLIEGDIITINSRTYEAVDGPLPGNDDSVLLLHGDGDDAAQATTDASPSAHAITFVTTAQLDTVQKKWGTASFLFDGDSDTLTAVDSADWDVFGATNTTQTIDFWVKHADHAGNETYIGQYEDANNYWRIEHQHGLGLLFYVNMVGSIKINTAAAGEITDTNWHHIMLFRSGSTYGLYKDGTQIGYDSETDTDAFAGLLYIADAGAADRYFQGWIDEIRISQANHFSASPNSGKTDTITIPTKAYVDSRVAINISSNSSIAHDTAGLATTINGDSSGSVYGTAASASVLLEARTSGSAGNAYDLSETETGGNTDDISVSYSTLTGGGVATDEAYMQCSATIDFPANASVLSGYAFANFDALFDKVDIFRSINLGDIDSVQGSILYLEQTLDMPANAGAWDTLTTTIGTKPDESLPFQIIYDPEKDIILAPPQSGSIGRYEKLTFMAEAAGVDSLSKSDYDTVHSSIEHVSPEYFTTYNRRKGDPEEGRPLRFINAGGAMLILEPNAIVHVLKSTDLKPLIYTVLHRNRGLTGKGAAHAVGNSVFMITGIGLVMVDVNNGQMQLISSASRILLGTWLADLANVQSCYDSHMNASFFLNPTDSEMLVLWHATKTVTMLEGANFVTCSSTVDITASSNKKTRAYFITDTGLIVTPDYLRAGTGTMWGLATGTTLDGTTTTLSAAGTHCLDSGGTFHADMVGCLLYWTSGANAGEAVEISAVASGDLTTAAATNAVAKGDRYSISPVKFSVKLWPLQMEPSFVSAGVNPFMRWILKGVQLSTGSLSGFTDNDNDYWRLGAYRNGGSTIESATAEADVNANPSLSAGAFTVDGIEVEPYLEQISCGTDFELEMAEISVTLGESRKVT